MEEFEIVVTGQDRVSVTELSERNPVTGTILLGVRGTSATPESEKDGDTAIEARLEGNVCGSAPVIVVVPTSICGPCSPRNSSSSSSGGTTPGPCPNGSHRQAENLVLDGETSPAWPGLPDGKVKLVTAWTQWMTIQVCDQFENPLDGIYSGCCVEERGGGAWHLINQFITDEGTYQDPVGLLQWPTISVVDWDSDAAKDWPTDQKLDMAVNRCFGQGIRVRVCGHILDDTTARKVCHRKLDCVWVVCPDGTIIV